MISQIYVYIFHFNIKTNSAKSVLTKTNLLSWVRTTETAHVFCIGSTQSLFIYYFFFFMSNSKTIKQVVHPWRSFQALHLSAGKPFPKSRGFRCCGASDEETLRDLNRDNRDRAIQKKKYKIQNKFPLTVHGT